MKLLSEINEWCEGAAAEFGDPAVPLCQIFCRFVPDQPVQHDDALAAWNGSELMLALCPGRWLPVPIDPDGMQIDETSGSLAAFGIKQICPGFWTLSPSLNMPGFIHAYVHIFGVPAIAPWDRRIVVVSSFRG